MNEINLQHFPTTLYIITVTLENNSLKILNFQLLNHGNNTSYSIEEFTKELIKEKVHPTHFKKFAEILKNNKNQKVFEIKYQFKDKNGKILTFKDTLKLIEKKDNIYTFLGLGINISKEEELSQIFNALIKSNHLGLAIYKEKIVFCDEYFKKIFEIENINELSFIDLFPNILKSNVKNTINKRLNGEFFNRSYTLELPTFKNNRRYIELYGHTIIYNGEFAGFVLVIDKTKFFKNKKMLSIIKNVNSILLKQIFNKEILLDEIANKIKEVSFFKDVFISNEKIDKENFLNLEIEDKYLVFEAKYNDDFDELCIETLNEIQKNIQKALKDIKKNLALMIFKEVLENSFQWLMITDENQKIIYINDAVTKISGYTKEDLIGQHLNILKTKNFFSFNETTSKNINKNNQIFYLKNKTVPINLPNGKTYFVSLGIDITDQKKLEKKLSDIKLRDEITNLPNRNGFIILGNDKLNKTNTKHALLIMDIKDFRAINEIKGIEFGDKILKKFTNILNLFFENSIIARIGNDEFAILSEYKDISCLLETIKNFISNIKTTEIESIKISLNIGIAIYPDNAKSIEELIEKALIALQISKDKEEYTYEFYKKKYSKKIHHQIQIKTILDSAINEKKFIYYFQPYVDASNLQITSAESLIRIKDNDKLIYPSEFIDYAEKSGKIKEIENIMAKKAIDILNELTIPLSFNISAISLKDEEHLNKLIEITKDYSHKITIEITEREFLFNTQEIINIIKKLKKLGYKIAIDDFGTGYSSFSYIKNIPLDYLKIDISFVRNIENSQKDKAIVDSIIHFSKKLNIKTIAEGIENKNQIKILQNLGCDYLQGYYFSKPIPLNQLKNILKNH